MQSIKNRKRSHDPKSGSGVWKELSTRRSLKRHVSVVSRGAFTQAKGSCAGRSGHRSKHLLKLMHLPQNIKRFLRRKIIKIDLLEQGQLFILTSNL